MPSYCIGGGQLTEYTDSNSTWLSRYYYDNIVYMSRLGCLEVSNLDLLKRMKIKYKM